MWELECPLELGWYSYSRVPCSGSMLSYGKVTHTKLHISIHNNPCIVRLEAKMGFPVRSSWWLKPHGFTQSSGFMEIYHNINMMNMHILHRPKQNDDDSHLVIPKGRKWKNKELMKASSGHSIRTTEYCTYFFSPVKSAPAPICLIM